MFPFQYQENFEPSKQTKEWCLYTHKTEESFGGVRLPGLFQTSYYEWQVLGFILILVLETMATYWAWDQGVAVTAIMVSIFIDIFLAIIAHLPQKAVCRLENEKVYEVGEKNKAIQRKINRKKAIKNLFYVLILFSAAFKFTWFYLVYMTFDSTALFILTCYLLGAVLHITCTGYAFFTTIFNWKIRSEHSEYIDTHGEQHSFDPAKPLQLSVRTKVELLPVQIGRHELVKRNGKFFLLTRGILTDEQLSELVGRQPDSDEQRALAIEGVRQQVAILKQTPSKIQIDRAQELQQPLPEVENAFDNNSDTLAN